MSAVAYCYDNALAESLFASIKSELLPEEGIFHSKSETYTAIFDCLEHLYNHRCFHSATGYQSLENFLTRYSLNQQLQLN